MTVGVKKVLFAIQCHDGRHAWHQTGMRREGGFQVYHTAFFYHRTDCCDAGLMTIIGIGYRRHGDDGAFLKTPEFVFKHIETDLQMLGIYDANNVSPGTAVA